LPNHTHKIIAGIVNGEALLNLFGTPLLKNGKEFALIPLENNALPFITIVPHQGQHRVASRSKSQSTMQYKHL
jgi:hypothetical protein